ncbi:MAG TPA: MFS transporter, partial [Candidatus Limnocylindrales bacterium]|nr:MFS transporter [Candidatus Limnocylindrales bacterium]
AVFLWWETRAADPIVRLDLFRIRNVAISVVAMAMVSFGFLGAIVFLPQWFQVVKGLSALESGFNLLPLVASLIVGATITGQIAAKTGKYRIVIFGAMVMLAFGLFLMTSLTATTELPVVWAWMVLVGLGIGPSFAVFTALVQNSVQPRVVGVATSSLTFFQQIGGTIGLTIVGTLLADSLTKQLPERLTANGLPDQMVAGFQQLGGGGQTALNLTGTGDLGQKILDSAGPFRAQVEPFITQIVTAIHEAFALAIATTFWVGIAAAVIAAVFVLFVRDPDQPVMVSGAEREAMLAG